MLKMLKEAGEKTKGIKIISSGTSAVSGQRASRNAIQVMQEKDIDIRNHQAKPLTPGLIKEADLILAMTRNHKSQVLQMSPDAHDKTYTLKEYASKLGNYGEISDEIIKLQRIIERKKADFFREYEVQIKYLRDQRHELLANLQQVDDQIKELEVKMTKAISKEQRELIYLQDKLPSVDISDPFGQPMGSYRECAKEIEEELKIILKKLLQSIKD